MDQSPTTGKLQWWVFSTRPRTYQNLANLQVSLFQWSNFIVSTKGTPCKWHNHKYTHEKAETSKLMHQVSNGHSSDHVNLVIRFFVSPSFWRFDLGCKVFPFHSNMYHPKVCSTLPFHINDLLLSSGYILYTQTTTMEPTNCKVRTMSFRLFFGGWFLFTFRFSWPFHFPHLVSHPARMTCQDRVV